MSLLTASQRGHTSSLSSLRPRPAAQPTTPILALPSPCFGLGHPECAIARRSHSGLPHSFWKFSLSLTELFSFLPNKIRRVTLSRALFRLIDRLSRAPYVHLELSCTQHSFTRTPPSLFSHQSGCNIHGPPWNHSGRAVDSALWWRGIMDTRRTCLFSLPLLVIVVWVGDALTFTR